MNRAQILWIPAFLAIGVIGGLVYNWPRNAQSDSQTTAESLNNDPADAAVTNAKLTRSEVTETRLTENPQQPSEPSTAPASDSPTDPIDVLSAEPTAMSLAASPNSKPKRDPVDGIWSDISPTLQRAQPIDETVLKVGDQLLIGGNAAGAYEHYSKLWNRANLPLDQSVLIRLGLAAELAGFYDQSEKHYRSAIRVSKRNSVPQLVSLIGTARVWRREGQIDDAVALLSELYLLYGGEKYPEAIHNSIVRQLADCLQMRLLSSPIVIEAIELEPMEYHFPPIAILPILDQADLRSTQAPARPITDLVESPSGQNPRRFLDLAPKQSCVGASILSMIADLQAETGFEFRLTEKAKSALVGRLVNVDATVIPLSLLLDQVFESVSLSWTQSKNVISIVERNELSDRESTSYDLARTQRMLTQVQLSFPEGTVRTAAIMNDANNSRLSGEWEAASAKYQAARDNRPTDELNAKLYFNEGFLFACSRRRPQRLARFLHDTRPNLVLAIAG